MFEWVIKIKLGIFYVIYILDDFFFVIKFLWFDCFIVFCNIFCLFIEFDIFVVLGKIFFFSIFLEFMGVLLDFNKMEVCFLLDKLIRIKEVLYKWFYKKFVILKDF